MRAPSQIGKHPAEAAQGGIVFDVHRASEEACAERLRLADGWCVILRLEAVVDGTQPMAQLLDSHRHALVRIVRQRRALLRPLDLVCGKVLRHAVSIHRPLGEQARQEAKRP